MRRFMNKVKFRRLLKKASPEAIDELFVFIQILATENEEAIKRLKQFKEEVKEKEYFKSHLLRMYELNRILHFARGETDELL